MMCATALAAFGVARGQDQAQVGVVTQQGAMCGRENRGALHRDGWNMAAHSRAIGPRSSRIHMRSAMSPCTGKGAESGLSDRQPN